MKKLIWICTFLLCSGCVIRTVSNSTSTYSLPKKQVIQVKCVEVSHENPHVRTVCNKEIQNEIESCPFNLSGKKAKIDKKILMEVAAKSPDDSGLSLFASFVTLGILPGSSDIAKEKITFKNLENGKVISEFEDTSELQAGWYHYLASKFSGQGSEKRYCKHLEKTLASF